MLHRTLRIAFRTLLVLVGAAALYLLAAFVLSRVPVAAEAHNGDDVTVYLLSNGVHTDVVLPVRNAVMDWEQFVPAAHTKGRDSTATWIAFGWGDKGFYMEVPEWSDLTARVAFRAAFGLSGSAMHVTRHHHLAEGPQCRRFAMDAEQYARLVARIRSGFRTGSDGLMPVRIPADGVYGRSDAFYEGTGRYGLFHTCNTWTNNTLKACGQRACAWTPFATGIMRWYE